MMLGVNMSFSLRLVFASQHREPHSLPLQIVQR